MNRRNVLSKLLIIVISLGSVACHHKSNSANDSKDKIVSAYYQEPHRPQIHFSPEANWMNDPNGMVYYDGEYHLFYQYYPDSTVWGPMHWGHAISRDMIHWQHLPIALYPDSLGYIFSGSAVIDWNNTSGLQKGVHPPMIAIFTHHDIDGEQNQTNTFQYQSIAYSHDKGRTWEKYLENPVVSNPGIKDFRDPKVIWDGERAQWVMVFAAYDKALFYTSPNLIDWKPTGSFGISGDHRLWECPDLFPMTIQGSNEVKWVLITSIQKDAPNGGTATGYFVGDFDGHTFKGDPSSQQWLDYGTDNYAFVTWSDIPEEDGRRVGIGWMSNWQYAQVVPTTPWRSAMTLPRELRLHKSGYDYTLRSQIVDEFSTIKELEGRVVLQEQRYTTLSELADISSHHAIELNVTLKVPINGIVSFALKNSVDEELHFGYNVSDQTYFIDRTFAGKNDFNDHFGNYHKAQANYDKEVLSLQVVLDRSSIELFADKGQTVMTDIYFASEAYTTLSIDASTNDVELIGGSIIPLSRIW